MQTRTRTPPTASITKVTTWSGFVIAISNASITQLVYALSIVETRQGAERIYRAELAGHKRGTILSTARRRLDDFDNRKVPNLGNLKGTGVNHNVIH